jgi:hypothetical protein
MLRVASLHSWPSSRLSRRIQCALDPVDCDEIGRIEQRGRQLVARRNELINAPQNAASGLSRRERETLEKLWKPTIAEIDQCRSEIAELQVSLSTFVDRLE